jgi:NAD(P)-dependent dehydrogenase (short-subunit alcohol dehydrogenase family)
MDRGLGGKIAMVSGARKGIGRAVAEKLYITGTTIAIDGGMTRTIF